MSLAKPFDIAHGVRAETENIVVRIEDEDSMIDVDTAAPPSYYGETAGTVEAVLPDLLSVVGAVGGIHVTDHIEREMAEMAHHSPVVRTTVSATLHDLTAKRLGVPLHRLWRLDPPRTPTSSYTVGLNDLDAIREKIVKTYEAGCGMLETKLSIDRDKVIIEAVRDEAPGVTIHVDANEVWAPRGAVKMTGSLVDHGVEFVEQPVSAEDHEGPKFAYDRGALPITADEFCITAADIPRIVDHVDIANLKLVKCGSPTEVKRAIHAAHAHGLGVIFGCMIEPSTAIAADCHLAPLLDCADLDGPPLLADDPHESVPIPSGKIDFDAPDRPGTDT